MKYYGIKTPKRHGAEPYIWWLTDSEHKSWSSFFSWPDRHGNKNYGNPPMAEAIRAYESIGYRCVRLKVKEE